MAKPGIILACDLSLGQGLKLCSQIQDLIQGIKLGPVLLLQHGLGVVPKFCEFGKVYVDLKLADIPYINSRVCSMVFESGAHGLIVHGFAGRDSVKACLDVARGYGSELYLVAGMTNLGSAEFLNLEKLCEIAAHFGLEGVVAPGNNPRMISRAKQFGIKVMAPGIGAQGGDALEAARAGADYLIMGRAIYQAWDPRKYLIELNSKLAQI